MSLRVNTLLVCGITLFAGLALFFWTAANLTHVNCCSPEWVNGAPDTVTRDVRGIVREVFHGFESGSIQQVIYQIGTKMLADIPSIAEVHLEANNRTWDTVAELDKGDERAEELGSFTEARPPFGILGIRLKR